MLFVFVSSGGGLLSNCSWLLISDYITIIVVFHYITRVFRLILT